MSSIYRKINYVEPGAWGSTEKHTLYAQFNATSDSVRVYDDAKNLIIMYSEWGSRGELDMGQALVKLLDSNCEDLEIPSKEEMNNIFH